MPAPEKILALVECFRDNLADYTDGGYKEARRVSFASHACDKTAIQRLIDATDREIDNLVYELYGLTDEEIGIVEEK